MKQISAFLGSPIELGEEIIIPEFLDDSGEPCKVRVVGLTQRQLMHIRKLASDKKEEELMVRTVQYSCRSTEDGAVLFTDKDYEQIRDWPSSVIHRICEVCGRYTGDNALALKDIKKNLLTHQNSNSVVN